MPLAFYELNFHPVEVVHRSLHFPLRINFSRAHNCLNESQAPIMGTASQEKSSPLSPSCLLPSAARLVYDEAFYSEAVKRK
jgi:hypothetical protein